ncbi:peptidoglycan DD-metalloendopeptidase family protein [Candidatus Pacearchaeota archaeon]|nr:peptidoglycan DD-metalloendopeptidase family protein [Candidatus Pacearchaeota archaeon]
MNVVPGNAGIWARLNLDEESIGYSDIVFQDPAVCSVWVAALHRERCVDYSDGGFLENRSHIWKNHYNAQTNAWIHLGVDFNVPAGTRVALLHDAEAVDVYCDPDTNGGWGGRVIWKLEGLDRYLIYGHLKQNLQVKVGQQSSAGEIFGEVGSWQENGGWFPHLHLQCVTSAFMQAHADTKSIDGYLPENHRLLAEVINPLEFVLPMSDVFCKNIDFK